VKLIKKMLTLNQKLFDTKRNKLTVSKVTFNVRNYNELVQTE